MGRARPGQDKPGQLVGLAGWPGLAWPEIKKIKKLKIFGPSQAKPSQVRPNQASWLAWLVGLTWPGLAWPRLKLNKNNKIKSIWAEPGRARPGQAKPGQLVGLAGWPGLAWPEIKKKIFGPSQGKGKRRLKQGKARKGKSKSNNKHKSHRKSKGTQSTNEKK